MGDLVMGLGQLGCLLVGMGRLVEAALAKSLESAQV